MKDYKKTNAARTTVTRDFDDIAKHTGKTYESLAIIIKRSNQISQEIKEHLTQKLSEFATSSDNLEEIFENREQIEISKFYERLPKSTAIALQEWLDNQIYFRRNIETSEKKID